MPMSASARRVALRIVPAALVVAALATFPASAQDDAPHPAHIHDGSCEALGDVVFPLTDVAPAAAMGTPAAEPEPAQDAAMAATPGAGAGESATSTTVVATSLDELLAAPHAINIHLSAEEIGTYIACGTIAGTPEDGRLDIALDELNGSGYSGEATLASDGDETTVEIRLRGTSGDDGSGTPAATAQAEQATLTVDIRDFAYDPNPVTVPVGGSVSWTNSDPVPHTATARDRDVLQTGTIKAGESVTVTFDAAGEYEYFCEFHSGMTGTLVVE